MNKTNIERIDDDTYVNIPNNSIELKTQTMDRLEDNIWDLLKQHAAAFGICFCNKNGDTINPDDVPPFTIIKEIEEHILSVFEKAGCSFKQGPEN